MLSSLCLFTHIFPNGLVVVVDESKGFPKVAIEWACHVGSRNEKYEEKGIAHLIEHMMFKGTERLSETDINVITHKLSGYTNAFTSHDSTSYVFSLFSWDWKQGLEVLADCMNNARFDEQMLNSEFKAVIQELKMYKDRYDSTLVDELLMAMFHDHPYHYPIIGFKQDLWNMKRDTLYNFYKQHYVPNNMVISVVGDVKHEDVFKEVERLFGNALPDRTYKKPEFYHSQDLMTKSVTLYRDINHPIMILATVLPSGANHREYVYDILSSVLASGKNSRLVKRLVDELHLVSAVDSFFYHLQDACPFFIYVEPYDLKDLDKIKVVINEEVERLIKDGVAQEELDSAMRKVKLGLVSMLEHYGRRAHQIARGRMFMGDENYIFKYMDYPLEKVKQEIKEILSTYFIPVRLNQGLVAPLDEKYKQEWVKLQELSDQEDKRILAGRDRHTEVEKPKSALSLVTNEPTRFNFTKATKATLSNGIKLFYHNDPKIPTVTVVFSFKARQEYDSQELQGLYTFMTEMLQEGSKNYPGTTIAQEIEKYGMDLALTPGAWVLTVLDEDLKKGLDIIYELLTNVIFDEKATEKIRNQMINELKSFWDSPIDFSRQLIADEIYKGHPFSKNEGGTFESLEKIKTQDLRDFYKKVMTHDGLRISVVGNLGAYNVPQLFEEKFGKWHGSQLATLEYPALQPFEPHVVNYPSNRDQVVLAYARPSITRFDDRYDIFKLCDQIFGGDSMNSRLFQIREHTGIFYGITGTLVAASCEQPGCFVVKTSVTKEDLGQAEKLIKNAIDTFVDSITEEDLKDAKKVVINSQINNFASNKSIAATFLSLDRFGFPDNYFDTCAERINKITLADVKKAVKEWFNSKEMVTFKVGRV